VGRRADQSVGKPDISGSQQSERSRAGEPNGKVAEGRQAARTQQARKRIEAIRTLHLCRNIGGQ